MNLAIARFANCSARLQLMFERSTRLRSILGAVNRRDGTDACKCIFVQSAVGHAHACAWAAARVRSQHIPASQRASSCRARAELEQVSSQGSWKGQGPALMSLLDVVLPRSRPDLDARESFRYLRRYTSGRLVTVEAKLARARASLVQASRQSRHTSIEAPPSREASLAIQ